MKIQKVYPKDIIAFFVLMFSLALISMGINAIVSGIVIMIVTYYFTQRTDEELHPESNLGNRIKKVEEELRISKPQPIPIYKPDKKQIEKEFENIRPALETQKSFPSSGLS